MVVRRVKPGPGAPKNKHKRGASSDDSTNQSAKTAALKEDQNPERLALKKFSWEMAEA